ncbi:hypothetical protein UFOVP111_38 [uncultured Caudovirales phage]|uniref:Uncharacterized protein n=1 Tax=uncultured Caudovirales phage TaxID=2100421 RepID=A0A6J5L3Y7_9CAUD|nr:hypothetical protein UFOVP111_38 [uncultured Caudovirales phage]
MATQYSVGHGMRRRNGTPSNPLEAAGTNMARNHPTSDEHHASAGAAGSHRIALGNSMPSFTPVMPTAGTLMPRKNTQAGDPTGAGSKQNRSNVEYNGASYRVQPKATFMQLDPAAGPTMANARIIPSVQGRANPNFESGMQASY